MKLLPFGILLMAGPAAAQSVGPASQLTIYYVKPGAETAFIKGYREHLGWHVRADDSWPWYVWQYASGERAGQHIGGSFDHDWAELERRPSPAEDRAHHASTIDPHLDRVLPRFLERRGDLGGTLASFESPFLVLVEVRVRPGDRAAFERAVKNAGRAEFPHAWFEVVSGDDHPTYLAFVALRRRSDLAAAAPQRLGLIPAEGVASARSELLRLLPDTSTCKLAATKCLGTVRARN